MEDNPDIRYASDDDADLLDGLEDVDDAALEAYRAKRLAEMQQAIKMKQEIELAEGRGRLDTLLDEPSVFSVTTAKESPRVVVHFFHKDFRRCDILDKHLETLAAKHMETRFVRVNVEIVPFLVVKLNIRTLPCVIMFIDGLAVDRLVGFEELGETDTFKTELLERRLAKSNVIRLAEEAKTVKRGIFGEWAQHEDEDE